MKKFRYEVRDEFGIVRCHDSKWDAYHQANLDPRLWVKVNPTVKVNRFIESFKQLGEALI